MSNDLNSLIVPYSLRSQIPKSGEEYDLRVPRDMAYIFSGAYIPLSCKLIEQVGVPQTSSQTNFRNFFRRKKCARLSSLQVLERDGWTGLEEVTRMLNGQEFSVTGPEHLAHLRMRIP